MTRSVTLAGYAAIVAMTIALEIVARRTRRVVPIGRAVGLLTGKPAVQVVVLAGWIWLGWHLFVRAHR